MSATRVRRRAAPAAAKRRSKQIGRQHTPFACGCVARIQAGFSNSEGEWTTTSRPASIPRDFVHPDERMLRLGQLDRQAVLQECEADCTQRSSRGRVWNKDLFQALALEAWLEDFPEIIGGHIERHHSDRGSTPTHQARRR